MTTMASHNDMVASRLEIVGCYSIEGEFGPQLALDGHSKGLHELAELLASDNLPLERALNVPRTASPAPYDHFLTAVKILHHDDAVQMKLEGSVLVITGSMETRRMFAERVAWLADHPDQSGISPRHIHLDDYPSKFYLSPLSDTKSLVITVIGPDRGENGMLNQGVA